jgi:hypothetical protein
MRKISPQPGFDPRTLQPVDSRYTDYAIPAPNILRYRPTTTVSTGALLTLKKYEQHLNRAFQGTLLVQDDNKLIAWAKIDCL